MNPAQKLGSWVTLIIVAFLWDIIYFMLIN